MIISFSGVDGSGKSVMAHRLVDALQSVGFNADYGRPDYACNAKILKYCSYQYGDEYAYYPMLPPDYYLSILCLDWITWYLEDVRQLANDTVVCCDRYVTDVVAQAVQYGASIESVLTMLQALPQPDLCFFLETEPSLAIERIHERGAKQHSLESLQSLTSLNAAYVEAERRTWPMIHLDTTQPLADEFASILGYIRGAFGAHSEPE